MVSHGRTWMNKVQKKNEMNETNNRVHLWNWNKINAENCVLSTKIYHVWVKNLVGTGYNARTTTHTHTRKWKSCHEKCEKQIYSPHPKKRNNHRKHQVKSHWIQVCVSKWWAFPVSGCHPITIIVEPSNTNIWLFGLQFDREWMASI